MNLTKGVEQASYIIALLAMQTPNKPLTSTAIHNRLNGSPTYLKKITRKLVIGGLVSSVPGNSGGFLLNRPCEDISLLDIIETVETNLKTYPSSGLFEQMFPEYEEEAKAGDILIEDIFEEADLAWRGVLASYSVSKILQLIFKNTLIPQVDWNEVTPKSTTLINQLIERKSKYEFNKG